MKSNYGYSEFNVEPYGTENLQVPLQVNCCGYDYFLSKSTVTTRQKGRLDYYFIYVIKGKIEIDITEQSFSCFEGDYILLPPHTAHKVHYSIGSAVYWIHFTGKCASDLFTYNHPHKLGLHHEILEHMKTIISELQTRKPYYQDYCNGYFWLLYSSVKRHENTFDEDTIMEELILYIHENLHLIKDVNELSEQVGLSPSRLIHRFTAYKGISPIRYLIQERLEKSKQLLLQTDMTIQEVADQVGYQNQLYFSQAFKKHTSYSPTAFRKSNLN
ncbi:helix-turn-helix domain-containing protein [Vallitalea okinawensis]|uniref:helix-turn-helix domain-containing protein n=1 Tax=Vallitalea okinawensis TaxID=2078660 RepID=UPI000CFD4D40|nr:AraC family transcriptional regulator [Vallitalea okinawensis]